MDTRDDACVCRQAVERAYLEMRQSGRDDVAAFETAVRVYRFHHPERNHREARFAVADWLEPANSE